MTQFKPNEVIPLVKQRQTEKCVNKRIKIMDDDLDLYDLLLFNTNAVEGTPLGSNFRSFTSNEPRTFADKLVSLLVSGELIINVPYKGADERERTRYDTAEKFWAGSLAQADERLERALKQVLEVQIATQLSLRGTCAARVLIRNKGDKTAFVDITPYDPRHCVWEASDEGMIWFCAVTTRTVAQIRKEYPKANLPFGDTEVMDVYDFYDEENNFVLAEGNTQTTGTGNFIKLKKETQHGQTEVPVIVVPGGSYSGLKPGPLNKDVLPPGYGESVFASVRELYPVLNEVMSIYLELVAKSRDQTYVLYSDSDIEIEENPNDPNGVLHLDARDKLQPIEVPETTKDAAQLVGLIQAMIQRGTLPQTAFGELAFQLSGFAITQLRQSLFSTMEPNLRAMALFYKRVCMLLSDQLVTDTTNPLELSGQDRNREWFMETFNATDLENIPRPNVKIAPQLPQDDAQKLQLAQSFRQGPNNRPLLPDVIILDEILEMSDANKIIQMVDEQMAGASHPAAQAILLAKAADEMGREDIRDIYLLEVQKALAPAPTLGPIVGPGGLGAGPGGGPSPSILPPEVGGLVNAGGQPGSQGPSVAPGTPRPGANI